jgi:hypothetical protein
MPPAKPLKYDAVVFDLLTALLDSWTLWNEAAGSPEDGMRWRKRYLEITYGCGAYRPYETLVHEAATYAGLPASCAESLEACWREIEPWPEVPGILGTLSKHLPLAVATNCSERLGHIAARRASDTFKIVITAEHAGFYKPFCGHSAPRPGARCSLPAQLQTSLALIASACPYSGTIASTFRQRTAPNPNITSVRCTGCPSLYSRTGEMARQRG